MSKRQSRDHIEPTGDLFAATLTADDKLPPAGELIVRRLIRWALEPENKTEAVHEEVDSAHRHNHKPNKFTAEMGKKG